MEREGHLYQIAVTPVYVESIRGQALLNVLVAGYAIDALVAQQFKKSTGGSEFLFLSGGRVIASTLNPRATAQVTKNIANGQSGGRIGDGVFEYAALKKPLIDVEGKPIAFDAEGYLARVLQHQVDHLDGVLFVDRLSLLKRQFLRKALDALARGEMPEGYVSPAASRGSV